ncbi:hypothetical protein HYS84_03030 [Candidatus Saccharibacteria bacterium]|nr:hypothetical protein [Candidatus Saccharibacteria bacterium]
MSPREDSRNQPDTPETEVQITHEEKEAPPVTAPPLPIVEPPTPEVPPERPVIPPPIPPEDFYEEEKRRWPMVVLYVILALLVATAVVFAGRWIYQQITDNKPKPAPPAGTGQGQAPAPPEPAQPTTPSPGGQPAAGGQLPNNGPGDVVALFVGTTIVVGGLHYLYSLRRG